MSRAGAVGEGDVVDPALAMHPRGPQPPRLDRVARSDEVANEIERHRPVRDPAKPVRRHERDEVPEPGHGGEEEQRPLAAVAVAHRPARILERGVEEVLGRAPEPERHRGGAERDEVDGEETGPELLAGDQEEDRGRHHEDVARSAHPAPSGTIS